VKEVFRKRGYHVRVIENSKDIDSDVCNIVEKDEEFKNSILLSTIVRKSARGNHVYK